MIIIWEENRQKAGFLAAEMISGTCGITIDLDGNAVVTNYALFTCGAKMQD